MEDLEDKIKHAFNKLYRQNRKWYHVACAVGIILLAGALALIVCGLLPCADKTIWEELAVNLLATVIGLFTAYILYRVIFLFAHRNEDKNKVSYSNSDMWKQYNMHYLHWFKLHKDALFAVYCEELLRAGTFTELQIDDYPDEFFELDPFIKSNFFELIEAHAMSDTTRSVTVRLKEVVHPKGNNLAVIRTMRSTYLSHLLTNRALDYELKPEMTIRSLFENSDTLIPPQRSRMSNHFGINALVFLKDEEKGNEKWLLLPQRGPRATVAKNKVTASIATRLKMETQPGKYAGKLQPEYVTKNCIYDCIAEAIQIPEEWVQDNTNKINIQFLGLSRDIYEGGKPTLFYTVHLDINLGEYEALHSKFDDDKKQKKAIREDEIRQGHLPVGAEKIDEVETIHIVEWSSVTMSKNLAPIIHKREKEDYYNTEFDTALLSFKARGQKKTYERAFEQNLIANFWFYRSCPDNDLSLLPKQPTT
ncbi:MAG: hypothetical protein IJQ95_02685 [Paludibacteraceae bacterium]|nr:hypothetical protein [Paludibacteraceae bacterium]